MATFKVDNKVFNRQLFTQILEFWFADLPRTAAAPSRAQVFRWFGGGNQQTRQTFDDACRTKFQYPLDLLGPASVHLPKSKTYEDERANAISLATPFLELEELRGDDVDTIAEGVLSLILLLDQFSRNLFRDRQALIYSHYDRLPRALTYCSLSSAGQNAISSVDARSFCRISPPHRIWFYMPLMHSEHIKDHDQFNLVVSSGRRLITKRAKLRLGI